MISIVFFFQISTHIKKECPLSMVSCPYDHMGCTTKVILRTDLYKIYGKGREGEGNFRAA